MDPRALRAERRARVDAGAARRQAEGRNAPRLVRWRRFRRRVGAFLLELCAPMLLRLLALTWRIERRGERGLATLSGSGPWVVAMWHGRMLTLMPMRLHKGRGIHVLVSPSDDGSLATRALRAFRYRVIRGSLSRGGSRALREMAAALRGGQQLVVTPDGPRGPRHTMNVGVPWLARAAGVPVLPVGVACSRAWHLRSWDRFTIPKPFARLVVVYADPVVVPDDAPDEALEQIAAQLRATLLKDERQAFAALDARDDLEGDAPETTRPGGT